MSDTRDPETDQPLPVHNANEYVQEMVIADLHARMQHGIRKYGTALQAGNGRNMLQDAYEEVLDLAVYLRGEIEERKGVEADGPTADDNYAAARVRNLRTERGMTQQGLAALMVDRGHPWTQTTIVRTEAAARPLRLVEAVALAEVFGVPVSALVGGR